VLRAASLSFPQGLSPADMCAHQVFATVLPLLLEKGCGDKSPNVNTKTRK
jgi:hypothetical protein